MKANTPDLMKFKRLQRKLHESRRGVIGLLESLWIETAKNCPQGDIGRFSNEEIAIMVDWDGDPDFLVNTMVECRWLDQCGVHRLVVHDWKDHCPTYVKGGLSKQNKAIAIATPPEVQAIGTTSEDQPQRYPLPSQAYSSQAKPSQQITSDSKIGHVRDEDFEIFWKAFPSRRRTKKQEAYRRWKLALKKVSADMLIRRAAEYAVSPKGQGDYAVMPSVWLNAGMWADEPEAWGIEKPVSRHAKRPTPAHDMDINTGQWYIRWPEKLPEGWEHASA